MNKDFPLNRYMIIINGSYGSGVEPKDREYNTDPSGDVDIQVYKAIESKTPQSWEVGHITKVGEFRLNPKHGKTLVEFLGEIKEELLKIASKD